MKELTTVSLILCCASLLSGCEHPTAASSPEAANRGQSLIPPYQPKELLATVNGKPIARSALEGPRGMMAPPDEKRVDELISREVIRQYAEKQRLLDDPALAEKLDNMLRQALSQMALEDYMKKNAVTEEAIRAEYDQRFGAPKLGEVKARQILVENEAAAREVIAQLQKGIPFEQLAKTVSKDAGSKDKGGDLGWFDPKQKEAALAVALEGMKNGEIGQTPIQTKLGWHVLQREDSRNKPAPPLDSVKSQIRMSLQGQKFQQFVEEQKKLAQIERKPLAPKTAAPAGSVPARPDSASPAPAGQPAAPKS